MKFNATINILAVERFDIEGNKICKVYVQPDTAENEPDRIGAMPIIYKADYGFIDQVRTLAAMPAVFEAECEMVMGKGKVAAPFIHTVKPTGKAPAPAAGRSGS